MNVTHSLDSPLRDRELLSATREELMRELDELRERIKDARANVKRMKDMAPRKGAEFENLRNSTEQELVVIVKRAEEHKNALHEGTHILYGKLSHCLEAPWLDYA